MTERVLDVKEKPLSEARRFFAEYVEDIKRTNPSFQRKVIIDMAVKIFGVSNPNVFFRKCVYCDSWEVRQTDGYCFHCNAYSGWYLEPSSEVPKPSELPKGGAHG